jgi:hypothetical protein
MREKTCLMVSREWVLGILCARLLQLLYKYLYGIFVNGMFVEVHNADKFVGGLFSIPPPIPPCISSCINLTHMYSRNMDISKFGFAFASFVGFVEAVSAMKQWASTDLTSR